MDPLSITASAAAIVGLADLIRKFWSRLRRFSKDLKIYKEDLEESIHNFQFLEDVMCCLRESLEDLKNPRYRSRTMEKLIARNVFGQLRRASKKIGRRLVHQIDRLKELQSLRSWPARFVWAAKDKAATKALELEFKCITTPFQLVVSLVNLELAKLARNDPKTDPKKIQELETIIERLTKSVERHETLTKTLTTRMEALATSTSREFHHEVLRAVETVLPNILSVVPMTMGMTQTDLRPVVEAQSPHPLPGNTVVQQATASSETAATTMSPASPMRAAPNSNSDIGPVPPPAAPRVNHCTHFPRPPSIHHHVVHVTPDNFSEARQFHVAAPNATKTPGESLPVTAMIDSDLKVNLISIGRASELNWSPLDLDPDDPTDVLYPDGRRELILSKCAVIFFGRKRGRRGDGTGMVFYVCQHLQPEIIVGQQSTWIGSDDREGRTYLVS